MDVVKIEKLIEEIKSISKNIRSVETVLESDYYPDSIEVVFKFENKDDEYINENISLYAEIYMKALEKQKEYLVEKFNDKKIELIKETQAE